jgi:type 1 fimbriae regulatory protein FimB
LGRTLSHCEQRKHLHRSTVILLLHKYGEKARLPVAVNPHILRPACGYALADQGEETLLMQVYLRHRNIQHSVRYAATNPAKYEKL